MLQRLRAGLLALVLLLTLAVPPTALAADLDDVEGPEIEEGEDEGAPDGPSQEPPSALPSITINQGTTMDLKQNSNVTLDVAGIKDEELDGYTFNWVVEHNDGGQLSIVPMGHQARVTAISVKPTHLDNYPVVTVTATRKAGGGSTNQARCTIRVISTAPPRISVSPDPITLDVGDDAQLTATITPEDQPQQATWKVQDTAIATVAPSADDSREATVTALSPGETKIVVTGATSTLNTTATVTVRGIVLQDEEIRVPCTARPRAQLAYKIYDKSLEGSTLTWTSSDPGVVTADSNGWLFPVTPGEAVITVSMRNGAYTDSCKVIVLPDVAETITASARVGAPLSFSTITTALKNACAPILDGTSVSYLTSLRVDTDEGTLYYRYTAESDTGMGIGTVENYYFSPSSGQRGLSDVTFVPKGDFSGTAVISYNGIDSGGNTFRGEIHVTVAAEEGLAYTTPSDQPLQFNAEDFSRICVAKTGRSLRVVTFTQPDSSRGALYYRYVSANNKGTEVDTKKEYRPSGTPSLGDIYFVPDPTYNGTVTIAYTAENVNGDTYRDRITIRVSRAGGNTGDIRYTAARGGSITFDADDFNALSREITGSTLNYVQFDLPSVSEGTLYYDYSTATATGSRVTAGQSYYRNATPYIRRVSFVAAADFTGTAEVSFTGWDSQGNRFTGTVAIDVGSGGDRIRYQTNSGSAVTFNANDFDDLCQDITGRRLNYVRFELPSTSRGTLYYDYTGSSSTKVSDSRNYYRSGTPYLNRVSFVPASGFSGTTTVNFTGWDSSGEKFEGVVEISVTTPSTPGTIYYTAQAGETVHFLLSDFQRICSNRGGTLDSVRFTLPSSSLGTLRLNSATGQAVTATARYYPNRSPRLDEVVFVPASGTSGLVVLNYTGRDSQGGEYQGTIQIAIQSRTPSSQYFTDMGGYGYAVEAVDRLYEMGVVGGVSAGRYEPSGRITRGSFMVMLTRAFGLPAATGRRFSDVAADSHWAQAISTAQALGIADGYDDGTFRPSAPVTRQQAMVFIQRTLVYTGWSLGRGDEAILSGYRDGYAVSGYARNSMALMLAYGILSGTADGYLNPQSPMTRAQMAVDLTRAIDL